jgi:flagellar assembly protein FliH
MVRTVFRNGELPQVCSMLALEAPFPPLPIEAEEVAFVESVEEYLGPTADDLRREAESFKESWDLQRAAMISAAHSEADQIVKNAKEAATAEFERKNQTVADIQKDAEEKAAQIIAEAEERASAIESGAKETFELGKKSAQDEGRSAGYDEGYKDGKAEVDRLVERCHVVLERIQDKRADILADAEQQIVELTLMLTRKVVKALSNSQTDVITENVKEALRKVKVKGNVTIKVNLSDLEITTAHKEEFIALIEGGGSSHLQIHEDSSVDKGGCIVETDFGEIDARISSQLAELESRILELSPIQKK